MVKAWMYKLWGIIFFLGPIIVLLGLLRYGYTQGIESTLSSYNPQDCLDNFQCYDAKKVDADYLVLHQFENQNACI